MEIGDQEWHGGNVTLLVEASDAGVAGLSGALKRARRGQKGWWLHSIGEENTCAKDGWLAGWLAGSRALQEVHSAVLYTGAPSVHSTPAPLSCGPTRQPILTCHGMPAGHYATLSPGTRSHTMHE